MFCTFFSFLAIVYIDPDLAQPEGANPGIGGHSRKLKIKDFFKIVMITIAYLVSN